LLDIVSDAGRNADLVINGVRGLRLVLRNEVRRSEVIWFALVCVGFYKW
jgi:hypothetical protein